MRKAISFLVVTVLLVSISSMIAFAHGGHRNSNRALQQPQYELCTVNDCDVAGAHQHDDEWYCSYANEQADYEICTVTDCTELGLHEHDGVYYHCAYRGMRRGCGRGLNQ